MYNVTEELTYRAPDFAPPASDAASGKEAFATDTRMPYQRDLGRIIHSASFRRLQTKTQVMGTGEGDFHRTRLTHTLEVGQIGRGIVWNLAARTDNTEYQAYLPTSELMEAICYAHDLGHPPYGHAGERALHNVMKPYGGFEGNAQTIRILTRLEKYYKGQGIKPTRRLLLGVLKYPVAYSEYSNNLARDKPPKCFYDDDLDTIERAISIFPENDRYNFRALNGLDKPQYRTFDCSIMELADDIAYGVHDLEDGIGRRLLERDHIDTELKNAFIQAGVTSIREIKIDDLLDKLFSSDSCERKHGISLLVGFFILNVKVGKHELFESPYLKYYAYVDTNVRTLLTFLSKNVTFDRIVKRREVQTLEFKGRLIVDKLFNTLSLFPLDLVGESTLESISPGVAAILAKAGKNKFHWTCTSNEYSLDEKDRNAVARALCDYVAGMTNPYAEKYFKRLFQPGYGSSTDEL